MGKNRTNSDNYNKDYFTAGGIPQPAAEIVPDEEKGKLTRKRAELEDTDVEPSGPGENAEIARAMGHTARRKSPPQKRSGDRSRKS